MKTHTAQPKATITEITLLNEQTECLHLEYRNKTGFDYPLHKHKAFELNYVEHCKGVKRMVGDSLEDTGEYDLAIIGSGLEHMWAQTKEYQPHPIFEITIHFSRAILGEELLKNQYFKDIELLLRRSQQGVCFTQAAILQVKDQLHKMAEMEPGFHRFILLLEVLHVLAKEKNYHVLASEEFSKSNIDSESRRIRLATEYINNHFREQIRLQDLSDLVCMTPTAFSRFFSLRTHKSVSDYIIDCRLGYAARQLIDTAQTIVEICYDSGFNNVSNFNRLFKKRKGYTPSEYRTNYFESRIIGEIGKKEGIKDNKHRPAVAK